MKVSGTRWLNKRDACKYASVSNNTFQKWIEDGLKVSRIGNMIRVSTDEIDRYIEQFSAIDEVLAKITKALGGMR
jgi:excisionase family DNA binding protein